MQTEEQPQQPYTSLAQHQPMTLQPVSDDLKGPTAAQQYGQLHTVAVPEQQSLTAEGPHSPGAPHTNPKDASSARILTQSAMEDESGAIGIAVKALAAIFLSAAVAIGLYSAYLLIIVFVATGYARSSFPWSIVLLKALLVASALTALFALIAFFRHRFGRLSLTISASLMSAGVLLYIGSGMLDIVGKSEAYLSWPYAAGLAGYAAACVAIIMFVRFMLHPDVKRYFDT